MTIGADLQNLMKGMTPDAADRFFQTGTIEVPDRLVDKHNPPAGRSQDASGAEAGGQSTGEIDDASNANLEGLAVDKIRDLLKEHDPETAAKIDALEAAKAAKDQETEEEPEVAAADPDDLASVLAEETEEPGEAEQADPMRELVQGVLEQNRAIMESNNRLLEQLARGSSKQQEQRPDLRDEETRRQVMQRAKLDPGDGSHQFFFETWADGKSNAQDLQAIRAEMAEVKQFLQQAHQYREAETRQHMLKPRVEKALKQWDLPAPTRAAIVQQVAAGVQYGLDEREALRQAVAPWLPVLKQLAQGGTKTRPAAPPTKTQTPTRRAQLRAVGTKGSSGGKVGPKIDPNDPAAALDLIGKAMFRAG